MFERIFVDETKIGDYDDTSFQAAAVKMFGNVEIYFDLSQTRKDV
jgi:hypothetical protein